MKKLKIQVTLYRNMLTHSSERIFNPSRFTDYKHRYKQWHPNPQITPYGRGVEYVHRFPACRMRRLKRCPDGSISTAWNYADRLWKLYRDAGPIHCHFSQTYYTQFTCNRFYIWCNMLLTELHPSPTLFPTLPYVKFSHGRADKDSD